MNLTFSMIITYEYKARGGRRGQIFAPKEDDNDTSALTDQIILVEANRKIAAWMIRYYIELFRHRVNKTTYANVRVNYF